jgi:hypothetical protein
MNTVRHVIEIDWATIAMVTSAVLLCIYTYARLCYVEPKDADDTEA